MMGQMRPEDLRAVASRHFTVVGLHYDEESVFLPIAMRPADDSFEKDFDELRRELVPKGYIPMIVKDQGELGIYIARKPQQKYRSTRVNVIMLLVTICTTVFAGTVAWAPYENIDMFSGRSLLLGSLFFALPLMLILGVHELSHYLAARRHGVAASLPFFLPAFPPLGTFGAFISMRDPIPDRKALLDIGVSGPIAGFIMAIIVTFIGVWLTGVFAIPVPPDTGGLLYLGSPLLFDAIWRAIGPSGNYLMHPTAFAGWVGFLVTALNLLPAGQLDGGHVARALFGEKTKYAGFAAVIVLGVLSMVSFNIDWATGAVTLQSGYFGWIVFIFLILFLGLYHPPPLNDLTKLDTRRKGLGALAILILVVAFVPVPMVQGTPEYGLEMSADVYDGNLDINGTINYTLHIVNTGNVGSDMKVNATFTDPQGRDAGWQLNLSRTKIYVDAAANRTVNLTVRPPQAAQLGAKCVVQVRAWPDGFTGKRRSAEFNTTVGFLRLTADPLSHSMPAIAQAPDYVPQASFNVTLHNLQDANHSVVFNLSVAGETGWFGSPVGNISVTLAYPGNYTFWLNVTPPADTPPGTASVFLVRAEEAGNSSRSDSVALTVEMPALHVLTAGPLPANATSLSLARNETANVTLAFAYRGNFNDSYQVEVRSSTGLNVSFEPGPLEFTFDNITTAGRQLTFSVAPDAPLGLLSATVSFRSDFDRQVQAEIDFTVLVE
jgi:membrane-associated protease RseP (regulator of RpoE activity)